jgi:imidazolonepropionase-like amidohydrolase
MQYVSISRKLLPVLSFMMICPYLFGQETPQDRRRWLSSSTVVSDDPRRIPVPPVPRGPEGSLVLKGGRVFDATGAPTREATVVIQRNHILKILPPGSTDWASDARVIDVSGKTVMPGMIDLHTHLTHVDPGDSIEASLSDSASTLRGLERMRYFIESGITSIRDVASRDDVPFQLKQWVSENRVPGPRIFPAGKLITAVGGHGAQGMSAAFPLKGMVREASGPDDWRQAVREQFEAGADVIKIASHFSPAEVKAAVEEAHALGIKVTCDCETFYVQWAVEAGVDCIEHMLPRTDETIRLMAQKHVDADPTLVVAIYLFDQYGGYYYSTSRRFAWNKEMNLEVVRRMKDAGIRLGVGTDLVGDWWRSLPLPYITELHQFVKLGYTIPGALQAATKTNAEILDMSDKLGTLEPGKLADVIVVDGKPDQNLDDLEKMDIVIRDGYIVVQEGRIVTRRHEVKPPPKPRSGEQLTRPSD